MPNPSIQEQCNACGRNISAGHQAFVDGDHILCALCYQSKNARNAALQQSPAAPSVHSPRALAATLTPVPRYTILKVAAYVMMTLAIIGGICIIGFGIFVAVGGSAIALSAPRPANPLLVPNVNSDPRGALITASVGYGLLIMLYGALYTLFTVAFAQLLLAIRDIAINSFHSRNALARLR